MPVFVASLLGAGAIGGVLGGAVALEGTRVLDGSREAASAPVAASAAAPESEFTQLRAVIEKTLPAIVTVIADLPQRGTGENAVQTRNVGSGVVIDDAGHVVTNYHVVEGAQSVAIALATGEQRPARIVGDDSPFTDLAVLQMPAGGLRSVPLAASKDVRIGEPVVAMGGSAIAGQNSAAFGIVAGVRRAWPRPNVTLEDLLQTDAAVNHGDSGGALLTRAGVIGLLTTVVRDAERTPHRGGVVRAVDRFAACADR
ncbi:MAG: trypsin-like peptidase domain-containing protein [Dehalococcoidia bacterium]